MTDTITEDGRSSAQLQVRFYTRQEKYVVSDTALLVPARLKKNGLQEVINHLLNLDEPVAFDFLIKGQFLRTSLQTYLDKQGISTENVIEIEYIEASAEPTPQASFEHDDWVSSVAANSASNYVLTGSYDGNARVWDYSGNIVAILGHHEKAVKAVKWIKSQETSDLHCLSGGMDQKLLLWKLDSNNEAEVVFEAVGHESSVEAIAVNSENFASSSLDGTIFIWSSSTNDLEESSTITKTFTKRRKQTSKSLTKRPLVRLEGHVGNVAALAYDNSSSENATLFSGGWDQSIRVWDIETANNVNTINCENVVLDLDYSVHSNLLLCSDSNNHIKLFDTRSKSGQIAISKFVGHKNWVSSVRWSPNNSFQFVSGSFDSTIKVWDTRSTTPLYSTTHSDQEPRVFSVDWQGDFLFSGAEDSIVKIQKYTA